MIKIIICQDLWDVFKNLDFDFFVGVPDSTFKDWMKFLDDPINTELTNIIACNECEAIAIAAGYHLATNKVGVVYMQNSGFGKTINPITSLSDPEVYSIPTLLMIGWRGEPDKKDEPQHKKMGRIMQSMLRTMEIPFEILPNNIDEAQKTIAKMKELAIANQGPVALIIKKGTFEKYESSRNHEPKYEMSKEDAIKTIIDNFNGDEIVVSTTGKTSRELYEYRVYKNQTPDDFYTVGSMGCSAAIAFGIATQKKDKPIFVFDGDGAVIMQMGTLTTIGNYLPNNLNHIIFDNSAYDSTGGQPTNSENIDFEQIALATGFRFVKTVASRENLLATLNEMRSTPGPNMLIIKVNKGSRTDLGRPTTTPIENKKQFMKKFGN